MKNLVVFSYRQPVEGANFRWGAIEKSRDTEKYPVVNRDYRWFDDNFRRTKTLWTLHTFSGSRKFYAERVNWKVEIPFLGSLLFWVGLVR